MEIPQEKIKKFSEIYRKNYGVFLGEKEAKEMALKFFQLMKIVYRPINKKGQ